MNEPIRLVLTFSELILTFSSLKHVESSTNRSIIFMMLAHTKSYLSLLYSSDSLITFHSNEAIFMTLEYHAWRGGRGSISKMLRTGAKLSPVGSRNRETSLMISLGWPSKPDNQAPWWGIQGVLYSGIWESLLVTFIVSSAYPSPVVASSEDGCELLTRDGHWPEGC